MPTRNKDNVKSPHISHIINIGRDHYQALLNVLLILHKPIGRLQWAHGGALHLSSTLIRYGYDISDYFYARIITPKRII